MRQKGGRIKPDGVGDWWSMSLEQKASLKGYYESALARGKEERKLW